MKKNVFYETLAHHYEEIYAYVEYEKQAQWFISTFEKKCDGFPKKLLDVACGTGKHVSYFLKEGWKCSGIDLSHEMIREAQLKNKSARFMQGNMQAFHIKEKFSLITCFFNAILYNKTKDELERTFNCVKAHLLKGGLLIFNMMDKREKIETWDFRPVPHVRFWGSFKFFKDHSDLELHFNIHGKQYDDFHVMGSYTTDEIEQLLHEMGFDVKTYDKDDSLKESYIDSKYALIVAKLR